MSRAEAYTRPRTNSPMPLPRAAIPMKPVETVATHPPSRCGRWLGLALLGSLAALACDDELPVPGPGSDAGPDDPMPDPRFATRLESPAAYARLAGEQWAVKYLARLDGRQAPAPIDRPCTFQDTNQFALHIHFLRSFPELSTLDFDAYLALATHNATRVVWSGELRLFAGAHHPRTGQPGVLGYFVYAEGGDPLNIEQLAEIDGRLKDCAPYARDMLVLVGGTQDQAAAFRAQAARLSERGVFVADHADLLPGAAAEGYSLGEAYGYLRLVPRGARAPEAGPRDILVIEGANDDIGLVGGLVTALPQNVHSHLNLRLREKAIPNARIPEVYADQALAQLDGRLARLTVTETSAQIWPAELVDAEAFWARRTPPVVLPPANLEERRLLGFESLRGSDRAAFGSKAANLGEIRRALPAAHTEPGFGIPFAHYQTFLAETGLGARIAALLADPRLATDAGFRRLALRELREAIEDAAFSPAFLGALGQAAQGAFGPGYVTLPIRFRSSSNVEDGQHVSGAGLHDSARGCFADDMDGDERGPSACLSAEERAALEAELAHRQAERQAHPERIWLAEIVDDLTSDLGKERTVARAIKKVYASLWNDRAFEERAYFSIDQATAQMGLAVNPSFVLESVNAVAVTNLPAAGGPGPVYRVVSQIQGQPVVRPPDPTVVAETLTFARDPAGAAVDVRVLTPSSLSPEPIWGARLPELAGLLFLVHDHFAAQVYPQDPELQLDLELKITRDGRIVIKQARPYLSVGP